MRPCCCFSVPENPLSSIITSRSSFWALATPTQLPRKTMEKTVSESTACRCCRVHDYVRSVSTSHCLLTHSNFPFLLLFLFAEDRLQELRKARFVPLLTPQSGGSWHVDDFSTCLCPFKTLPLQPPWIAQKGVPKFALVFSLCLMGFLWLSGLHMDAWVAGEIRCES